MVHVVFFLLNSSSTSEIIDVLMIYKYDTMIRKENNSQKKIVR